MRPCVVILLLALTGCRPPSQVVMQDVPSLMWDRPATVVFDPADTATLFDLALAVRYNGAFREDTLTLRIATCSPDSLRCEELLLLTFPPRHRAAPLHCERRIPYRLRVRCGRDGDYRMTFTPTRPVRGVESVGLQLENSR